MSDGAQEHPRSAQWAVDGLRLALSALWWEIVYVTRMDRLVERIAALLPPRDGT